MSVGSYGLRDEKEQGIKGQSQAGDILADLIRDDEESRVSLQLTVNETWFDKFD